MPTSPFVKTSRPFLTAITLGDPAGVGPEVALKALAAPRKSGGRRPLLLGPAVFFQELAGKLKTRQTFRDISDPSQIPPGNFIPCYFKSPFPSRIVRGRSQNAQTTLAVRSIELAVDLAMRGLVGAIVTPPINKAGLKEAGFDIPGHTEYLARLSGCRRFEMMLVGGNLRVVLVTRHTPVRRAPAGVTKKRVEETILLTDFELRRSFGIRRPRLAVCGLNPHAGEGGTIGDEEIRHIVPAVRGAEKKTGSKITGPLPPDVLFYQAYEGRYDAEICMYHDQGLIPLKMISRGAGVNITLGLPF
ncbi:MAG: 4-hydroxythreonine-4-phosphate dehydrogenase PdxA, partial [Candidatus Omnitrophica bacterium]|nr:4-hydroxythreonine-4-phosphate dehydrogenase PdxA [Candidatus Omnitrophota bacterium]